jgi:glucose-6-phosphate-specific signal transduction histidine kinase
VDGIVIDVTVVLLCLDLDFGSELCVSCAGYLLLACVCVCYLSILFYHILVGLGQYFKHVSVFLRLSIIIQCLCFFDMIVVLWLQIIH